MKTRIESELVEIGAQFDKLYQGYRIATVQGAGDDALNNFVQPMDALVDQAVSMRASTPRELEIKAVMARWRGSHNDLEKDIAAASPQSRIVWSIARDLLDQSKSPALATAWPLYRVP